MLVLLDTTVLIDCLRGKPAAERVLALRRSADLPCTTAINIEEIVRGLRPAEEGPADRLFRGLLVLPLGADEGRRAGRWRRDFARRGVTLSQADCLIAAAAHSARAVLATGKPRDFPMRELRVEQWPVGR